MGAFHIGWEVQVMLIKIYWGIKNELLADAGDEVEGGMGEKLRN